MANGELRSHAVRRVPVVDIAGMQVGTPGIDDVPGVLAKRVKDLSCQVSEEQRRKKTLRS